jgi:chloramphenicol-sensitive protein RarD
LWGILWIKGQWSEFVALWRDTKARNRLLLTSVLITSNWLIFVYAVLSEQTLEASLGYYINPLVSIALAGIFLGEKLTKIQWLAVVLASLGVLAEIWTLGNISWIACALAASFAVYGVARKKLTIDPTVALAAETSWMLPVAMGVLVYGSLSWDFVFWDQFEVYGWALMLAGVVTVAPLLLYVMGLPKVTLTIASFAQYIAPSMVFLLAVFWFQETLPVQRLYTFGLIWGALALVTLEGLHSHRKMSYQKKQRG